MAEVEETKTIDLGFPVEARLIAVSVARTFADRNFSYGKTQ